jgi:hypothetical protein
MSFLLGKCTSHAPPRSIDLILRSSATIRRRASLGDPAGNRHFHGRPAIDENRLSAAKRNGSFKFMRYSVASSTIK